MKVLEEVINKTKPSLSVIIVIQKPMMNKNKTYVYHATVTGTFIIMKMG